MNLSNIKDKNIQTKKLGFKTPTAQNKKKKLEFQLKNLKNVKLKQK